MRLKLSRKIIIGSCLCFITACSAPLSEIKESYERITRRYEEKLKRQPNDLALRIKLAEFYYDFKDYHRVKRLLDKIDADKAKALLAKALARSREYDYALEIFSRIKDKLKEPEDMFLYGEVLENKNLFPQALKIYERVSGQFRKMAGERVALIRSKTGEGTPKHIDKIIKEAGSFLKEVSSEAAIVLLVDEETEITPQNTSVTTLHVIEQIQEERGKELGEVEIGYDSTYERVSLEFARTISREGTVIYAGKENVRDVSRYLNFPLYSNAKAFIVSMPMVEVGACIEYKLKIYSSQLVNKDDFSFIYRLREKYPIFKAEFRLSLPIEREIHFKLFNEDSAKEHRLTPGIREEGKKKIHTWKFNKITPLIPEYNMPPIAEVNPAVLVSSFSSWEEIYNWWKALYKDKFALDNETKKFISGLVSGAESQKEQARRIYEFCAEHIRYVAVEYGESGYEPHCAQEVFINRYGDCKDQAILLAAMLKHAGIKGYPVLIPTRGIYPIDKDFPSVSFNHAICAADVDGEIIFMDPTAATTSFSDLPLDDQERAVMVFKDDSWQIARTPQITDNRILYKMNITLSDKENAVIEREVTTAGFFSSAHRGYLKYTHPLKIKEDIQKKMVEISPFSRLIDYTIENADRRDVSPVLKYKFETDKFLNPAGDLRIIPALNEIQLDHNIIGKEERRFPIDFEGVYSEQANIGVRLPGSLKVKYLPKDINVQNKWFGFAYSYQVTPQGLDIIQRFLIKQRSVAREEYKEFKKDLENVFYFLREEIILEKQL